VEGVRLLLTYSVTVGNVCRAHDAFRQYCVGVEEVWGGSFMKPNHHHLMHLKQCVLDYGPPHVFWVFAFERSNGLLANFHSSNRTVELEMMKRFMQQQTVLNQDHLSVTTVALENPHLLPSILSSHNIQSMQLYRQDTPLPIILQSAYNQSWFKAEHGDHYPYPATDARDTLATEPQLHQHLHQYHPTDRLLPPPRDAAAAAARARASVGHSYAAAAAPPMSLQVNSPCTNCAKLVDNISMLRTEDKETAVAFMPSSPRLWREFRQ
jgi:hypothetical protein